MSSYRCPKCSVDHRMYDPPIEVIHSDLFIPADEEPETFAAQEGDIAFDDPVELACGPNPDPEDE